MKVSLTEAFERALDRHYDDGHKDELLLGFDASRNDKPWFVVADNDPLNVLTYGATAIKALLTYARQGKSAR